MAASTGDNTTSADRKRTFSEAFSTLTLDQPTDSHQSKKLAHIENAKPDKANQSVSTAISSDSTTAWDVHDKDTTIEVLRFALRLRMDACDAKTRKIKSLAEENMWMLSDMLMWRNKYENLLRTVNGVIEHEIEEVRECESDQEV